MPIVKSFAMMSVRRVVLLHRLLKRLEQRTRVDRARDDSRVARRGFLSAVRLAKIKHELERRVAHLEVIRVESLRLRSPLGRVLGRCHEIVPWRIASSVPERAGDDTRRASACIACDLGAVACRREVVERGGVLQLGETIARRPLRRALV